MRRWFILVCVLSLCPDFVAGAEEGGTLRFGLYKDASTLNPYVNTRSTDHDIRTLIYEPLLTLDPKFNVKPYLAESWEISKDATELRLQLRKGVRFHNGKELTAEDVLWSIEYVQNPRNAAYGGAQAREISSAAAIDPYRIRLKLTEPIASFPAYLATLQGIPIVAKGSLGVADRPTAFPPGTGPYMFSDWKQKQELVLTKFKDYWQKGVPRIDRIEMKITPDPEARFAALRSGAVDLIERLPPQHYSRVLKGEIREIGLVLAPEAGMRGIYLNNRRSPFNDVRVRQAVAWAIDKEEILNGAYSGVGTVITQKAYPNSPWFTPIVDRKRDPAKARALLKEAGYPNGLKTTLSGGSDNASELQILKAELEKGGIEVELVILDPVSFLNLNRSGNYDITLTGGNVFADPDQNYFHEFHSEKVVESKIVEHRNITGYSNPKMDRLLEDGRRTTDFKKRQQIYKEVTELLVREVPALYTLSSPYIFAHRPYFKGFETRDQGRYFTGDIGLPMAWLEK